MDIERISVPYGLRMVTFDVEGTLTKLTHPSSIWARISQHLNVSEQTAGAKEDFFAGKISFEEWARLDALSWKGHSYGDIEEMVKRDTELVPGAKELIQLLQSHGVIVVLVSGGLDVQCNWVAEQLGVPTELVLTNCLGVDKSDGDDCGILDGTVNVRVTYDSKGEAVTTIAKKFEIDLACVCHIGDDDNDLPAFRACGESVAINPRTERVRKGARHCVEECSNLMNIVELLMPPARVVWIRHGQAEHNATRNPCLEHPKLTSAGVASVLELRKELRDKGILREGEDSRKCVSVVYSSPLERTIQTATLLFPKHCIMLDDRINEILGGNMASKRQTAQSIVDEWKDQVNIDGIDSKTVPWLGDFVREPLVPFHKRLKQFYREISASLRPGETVAVITHSGVLYTLLRLRVYTGSFVVTEVPMIPEKDTH